MFCYENYCFVRTSAHKLYINEHYIYCILFIGDIFMYIRIK